MMDSLIDIIAQHISTSYTFTNSDGEEYIDDGYIKAQYFIYDTLIPQIDKYINENYEVSE